MNNQRTIEEIKSYLMIHSRDLTDVDTIIKQAQNWEKEYETELNHHIYEYALLSDFINSPFILEDEDVTEMIEIKRENGLVLYKTEEKNND